MTDGTGGTTLATRMNKWNGVGDRERKRTGERKVEDVKVEEG